MWCVGYTFAGLRDCAHTNIQNIRVHPIIITFCVWKLLNFVVSVVIELQSELFFVCLKKNIKYKSYNWGHKNWLWMCDKNINETNFFRNDTFVASVQPICNHTFVRFCIVVLVLKNSQIFLVNIVVIPKRTTRGFYECLQGLFKLYKFFGLLHVFPSNIKPKTEHKSCEIKTFSRRHCHH